jgi:hypothetical protein
MVLTIARRLAESKKINDLIRKNIYIHGVKCACESSSKSTRKAMDGSKCFCSVDVDLMGSRKDIRTKLEQPTDLVSIEIDPVDYTKYADKDPFS